MPVVWRINAVPSMGLAPGDGAPLTSKNATIRATGFLQKTVMPARHDDGFSGHR